MPVMFTPGEEGAMHNNNGYSENLTSKYGYASYVGSTDVSVNPGGVHVVNGGYGDNNTNAYTTEGGSGQMLDLTGRRVK
jgi:hypothetical protein